MISIKNIKGTGDQDGSWLNAWRSYHGLRSNAHVDCCVKDCGETATDGAHVMVSGNGLKQFIVPMCHSHNLTYDVWFDAYNAASPMPVVE